MIAADHMFDEMLDGPDARGREPYRSLLSWLEEQDFTKLRKQSAQAEDLFRRIGITFNVYGDEDTRFGYCILDLYVELSIIFTIFCLYLLYNALSIVSSINVNG